MQCSLLKLVYFCFSGQRVSFLTDLKNDVLRATAMGALRSYCIHFLTTVEFLEDRLSFEANVSC